MGRGELSVTLSLPQVEESAVFQRDGFDIHSSAKISFTQAILGGEARIPGLNGHIMVKARNSLKTNLTFTGILTPLLSSPDTLPLRFLKGCSLTTRYG